MTSTKENTLAEKKQTGIAVLHDYGEDSGIGFEGTGASDLSVPFLSILQSNSPQVQEESPKGAAAGFLFNTVTGELTAGDKGVAFIPAHKETAFVEWRPREKGGGFVAVHKQNSDVVSKTITNNGGSRYGKLIMENGNELVETNYVYGLTLDDEGKQTTGFCVISFTSTKIKPYKDWTTSMFTLKGRPPIFANRALIKTVKQKNEKGVFHNFKIEPFRETWIKSLIDPTTEQDLLLEAKSFRDMVVNGMAKAAFETNTQEQEESTPF